MEEPAGVPWGGVRRSQAIPNRRGEPLWSPSEVRGRNQQNDHSPFPPQQTHPSPLVRPTIQIRCSPAKTVPLRGERGRERAKRDRRGMRAGTPGQMDSTDRFGSAAVTPWEAARQRLQTRTHRPPSRNIPSIPSIHAKPQLRQPPPG